MKQRQIAFISLLLLASPAMADEAPVAFSLFGSLELDAMINHDASDPNWDDMFRIKKIVTRGQSYDEGGSNVFTPRFSIFGAEYRKETSLGLFRVYAKFDLVGLGDYAGDTRPRISRLYVNWGRVLIGKNESLFRDGSAFPDTLEWYGPVGLAGSFPYQINYTHPLAEGHWSIGLEDVTEAIDPVLISKIGGQELYDPAAQQDFPDLTGHYRRQGDWGHWQIGGILRKVTASGLSAPDIEFKVSDTGWGLNLSGSRKLSERDTLRGGVAGGHGIAGYMNDGGADMVIANNRDPDTATAQDSIGWSAYLEHAWNSKLSSALGASQYFVANENFEPDNAYQSGTYASANLLYRPDKINLLGIELLWGQRTDNDGTSGTARSLLFTYRASFDSATW